MDILFLLVPVSFIFIVIAVRIFFWAVRDGQFDDLDGAAHSILFDKDKDLPSDKSIHLHNVETSDVVVNNGVVSDGVASTTVTDNLRKTDE